MNNKLTVVSTCSIHYNQKRPTYSKMWVDRLYKAVSRNLHTPFEFVCFSNDIKSDDYRIEPLTTNSWGWWNKLEQFKKGMFSGPVLSLDLDVIICKDITQSIMQLPTDKILMSLEPNQVKPGVDIPNSSVMFWQGDYSHIFDRYCDTPTEINKGYASPLLPRNGDQGFIADVAPVDFIDKFLPEDFLGWKHHITGEKINDPSILIFHSTEKPTNNLNMPLVQQHWIDS